MNRLVCLVVVLLHMICYAISSCPTTTLSSPSGVLNNTKQYSGSRELLTCTWIIDIGIGSTIELQFDKFFSFYSNIIDSNIIYGSDFKAVSVYDGPSSESFLIGEYSIDIHQRYPPPPKIYSTGSALTIVSVLSDLNDSDPKDIWSLSWKTHVPNPECDTVIDMDNNIRGTIVSPKNSTSLPCVYILRSTEMRNGGIVKSVDLRIADFSTTISVYTEQGNQVFGIFEKGASYPPDLINLSGTVVIETGPYGRWKIEWEFSTSTESLNCEPPKYPLYVDVNDCTRYSSFGSICDFVCPKGYLLNGPSRVTCELGGKWNPSLPVCVRHFDTWVVIVLSIIIAVLLGSLTAVYFYFSKTQSSKSPNRKKKQLDDNFL